MGALNRDLRSNASTPRTQPLMRPRGTPFLSLGTLISLSTAVVMANAASKLRSDDLALARDYVLAACVMDRYAGTPLAAEANAWATGLVERGNLLAEAYPALAGLARVSPTPGVSSDGIAMRLQSCVDFVNRRDFSSRLRKVLQGVK